jgi:hypothetical protein
MAYFCKVPWRSIAIISIFFAVLSGLLFLSRLVFSRDFLLAFEIARQAIMQEAEQRRQQINGGDSILIISGVTCAVSTISTFSSLWLSWRADRRQAREMKLKIAQLEIQINEARAQNPPIQISK